MPMVQMIPVGSSARRAALLSRIGRPVSWLVHWGTFRLRLPVCALGAARRAHAWRQALSLR